MRVVVDESVAAAWPTVESSRPATMSVGPGEDVVGAAQRFGSDRPAHSRKVGIDPPQARHAVERRLEARLGLAVVDAGAVEYQHRSAGTVLHVMDAAQWCRRRFPTSFGLQSFTAAVFS